MSSAGRRSGGQPRAALHRLQHQPSSTPPTRSGLAGCRRGDQRRATRYRAATNPAVETARQLAIGCSVRRETVLDPARRAPRRQPPGCSTYRAATGDGVAERSAAPNRLNWLQPPTGTGTQTHLPCLAPRCHIGVHGPGKHPSNRHELLCRPQTRAQPATLIELMVVWHIGFRRLIVPNGGRSDVPFHRPASTSTTDAGVS